MSVQPEAFEELASESRRLLLLGPQPDFATLKAALARLSGNQPVAVVTAGWQEDESADTDLMSQLPRGSTNLNLFQRSEALFEKDVELIRVLRVRQDELRVLRKTYLLRLNRCLAAVRDLSRYKPQIRFDLQPEIAAAYETLRQLDRQYLVRTTQICDHYDQELDICHRESVQAHRAELQQMLDRSSALVISGGHVGIILNRLRLFGILDLNDLPIVAWSAGAMALADQIVLFHDHPPQGKGNPEVLRAGMGLFHEVLPLPGARQRLQLDDRERISLLARRFDDFACIEFNADTIVERFRGHWRHTRCSRLKADGSLEELAS